jgi:hypothetical protein
MKTQMMRLAGAVVVAAAAVQACRDAPVAPRSDAAAGGPVFLAVSDTPSSQHYHFVSNGEHATVFWSTYDSTGGFSYGYLDVSRGGTSKAPTTSLYYYAQSCDQFYNCVYGNGAGTIPNRDFSGGGTQYHLSTNTATNPDFYTWFGPSGIIAVDWTADGMVERSQSGTTSYRYSYLVERTQGNSTYQSASASGSVVGMSIGSYWDAEIGTNHSVTIDIYRF